MRKSLATLALLVGIVACKTDGGSAQLKADEAPAAQAAPGGIVAACQAACALPDELAPGYKDARARCYSCQCKEAFGGWLPSPEDIQCDKGTEVVVYKSGGPGAAPVPVTTKVNRCLNPSQLEEGTCAPGSRFGQLQKGNVFFKWICRRTKYTPSWQDLGKPFDDFGIVGYNADTGVACFWDGKKGDSAVIAGHNVPGIDLTGADDAAMAAYHKSFQFASAACTRCHDNDPFIMTPYLKSVGWKTDARYTSGNYGTVDVRKGVVPVKQVQLTSEKAGACLGCHRITDGSTCEIYARDSMGVGSGGPHEEAALEKAHDKVTEVDGVPTTFAPGENWQLAYWMPTKSPPAASWEKWHDTYGEAKRAILECCDTRYRRAEGVPQPEHCGWTPVPGPVVGAP